MRSLALVLLVCAGCGGNTQPVTRLPDAGPPPPDALQCFRARSTVDWGLCNPLSQTGCNVGQKCTWFIDSVSPPLGHIDCAPTGSVPIGGACTIGALPCNGFDDCVRGAICWNGICEAICDANGGSPSCASGFACAAHPGLFGPIGQPVVAGACEPICDPLADNDFLGSGYRAGSACAGGTGCYGFPNDTATSVWSCMEERTSLVHRAPCNALDGCAVASGSPYLNGCAQGYIPLLYDATGSMQVDCIAMCAPVDCYAGHCGTNSANLGGASPHTCAPADARGTFNVASATNNGDQCMYSWLFEIDTMGNFFRSPTSDTVGFCVDHSKYQYDSDGNGTVGGSDAAWPPCDSFTHPGRGTGSAVGGVCNDANGCIGAADFGCVSTATGGVMFAGKPRPRIELRLPYR